MASLLRSFFLFFFHNPLRSPYSTLPLLLNVYISNILWKFQFPNFNQVGIGLFQRLWKFSWVKRLCWEEPRLHIKLNINSPFNCSTCLIHVKDPYLQSKITSPSLEVVCWSRVSSSREVRWDGGCSHCLGPNSTCRTVSGLFTKVSSLLDPLLLHRLPPAGAPPSWEERADQPTQGGLQHQRHLPATSREPPR